MKLVLKLSLICLASTSSAEVFAQAYSRCLTTVVGMDGTTRGMITSDSEHSGALLTTLVLDGAERPSQAVSQWRYQWENGIQAAKRGLHTRCSHLTNESLSSGSTGLFCRAQTEHCFNFRT